MFNKTSIYLTFLFLLVTVPSHAASVWKVSKDDNSLYIAGTIHLLSANDYPLPSPYQTAYDASETLVFETDMEAMSSLAFQQKSQAMLTYSDGTTLDSVLETSTLDLLKRHLADRNIPYDNFKSFKPALLSIMLSMIEFQIMGLSPQYGVDNVFATKAVGDGKQRDWLETPDEQLAFIANLANGKNDELVRQSINEITDLPSKIEAMKAAWRAGDADKLAEVGFAQWKKEFPASYNALLVDRNIKWVPAIESKLATPETEFVMVGALHLVGEDSVLTMLEKRGYTIEQMK